MNIHEVSIQKVFVVLFTICLAAAGVCAQPDGAAKWPTADNEAARKADEYLAQWDKKDMPGAAVGVVKDGWKLGPRLAVGSVD